MCRRLHRPGGAGPPEGLCWDQRSCEGGEPIVDDGECNIFEPNNVKPIVDKAVAAAREYAAGTVGNNVYFLMGSDFQYENSEVSSGVAAQTQTCMRLCSRMCGLPSH